MRRLGESGRKEKRPSVRCSRCAGTMAWSGLLVLDRSEVSFDSTERALLFKFDGGSPDDRVTSLPLPNGAVLAAPRPVRAVRRRQLLLPGRPSARRWRTPCTVSLEIEMARLAGNRGTVFARTSAVSSFDERDGLPQGVAAVTRRPMEHWVGTEEKDRPLAQNRSPAAHRRSRCRWTASTATWPRCRASPRTARDLQFQGGGFSHYAGEAAVPLALVKGKHTKRELGRLESAERQSAVGRIIRDSGRGRSPCSSSTAI